MGRLLRSWGTCSLTSSGLPMPLRADLPVSLGLRSWTRWHGCQGRGRPGATGIGCGARRAMH
eukprot:9163722-Alexandrium_andersonii.AAC.1